VYYTNSSVTTAVDSGVVVQDIELFIKLTGTITGSVTNVRNIIFNGAGVATPDPGEAPPMAGFYMRMRFRHRTVL